VIPDGLQAIAVVRRFLAASVVQAVPAELVGEVRAAVKLLDTVGVELAGLPTVLTDECRELLSLGDDGLRVLHGERDATQGLEQRWAAGLAGLDDLIAMHRDVRRLTATVVIDLQAASEARRVLRRLYETLRRHAERRIPWQSVFSAASQTPAPQPPPLLSAGSRAGEGTHP
jgi:hypothetical protein